MGLGVRYEGLGRMREAEAHRLGAMLRLTADLGDDGLVVDRVLGQVVDDVAARGLAELP